MKLDLFKKAKDILLLNQIRLESQTDSSVSFDVNDYKVMLQYRDSGLWWNCTCVKKSLYKAGSEGLCSHILAVLIYITLGVRE